MYPIGLPHFDLVNQGFRTHDKLLIRLHILSTHLGRLERDKQPETLKGFRKIVSFTSSTIFASCF